jgi:hypothetical protein
MLTLRQGAVFGFALAAVFLAESSAFAGAWPVTHKWSDQARPNDPTSGSFAYEYGRAAANIAADMTANGSAYDCADFAITVLCQYAAANGLEVTWTLPDPDNQWKTHQVSSTEARFTSPAQFAKWSRDWQNAKMVATMNTSPITYDQWRSGDVVMMRWNQLGDANPFPGRDVWHTYFVGDPDKLIFYGNIDGEEGPNPTPLAIVATATKSVTDEVRTSPAVYGASPRRWNVLKDSVVPPQTPVKDVPSLLAPKNASVKATALNVRAGPSTHDKVLQVVHAGDTLPVEGTTQDGAWVRVRRADGSIAYVSAALVSIVDTKPKFKYESDAPSDTTGINGALGDGNDH